MKKITYPWHDAVLNVQSTTRARFGIPVQLRTSDGYRRVEAKLPWGVTVVDLGEGDFLTVNGTPFRFGSLADDARAIRTKRDKQDKQAKAALRRRKARQ